MTKRVRKSESCKKGQKVALEKEIGPGMSKKFTLRCGGRKIEAMVMNASGSYYAYMNVCRHIPMSLDWVDNRFFTRDKRFLACATHGALYIPQTGECVWGPPVGEFLIRIPIEVRNGSIFARCPDRRDAED
jgi:nitrite reductase/ring-hydroxylating ferredoxin subunit